MAKADQEQKTKTKVLLLENIHASANQNFEEASIEVSRESQSLGPDLLVERVLSEQISCLGIRSKTQIRSELLQKLKGLEAIGTFCIGTNQVDLSDAAALGIPVFNAPYSNTRSVAELVIAEMISLSRKFSHLSSLVHQGVWEKTAKGSFEVRGKVLGIVGYGHIGSQVSILAEAMGLKVLYYDVEPKLPLGNARSCSSLAELLSSSDFVSLHVPETPETKNMISEKELKQMKEGSYLINASRGSVVVIKDLVEALKVQSLAGAAIDVYPEEPAKNGSGFQSELRGLENVILTPHIGGSTEEAQHAIGQEVSLALSQYFKYGDTSSAVNFPRVMAPQIKEDSMRLCHIHKNEPGVLAQINSIFSEVSLNVSFQSLSTLEDLGYLVTDFESLDSDKLETLLDKVKGLSSTIRARVIRA